MKEERMDELRAFVLILLQAPPAILRGRFDVDLHYSVYGFPARLVGVLLLQLVGFAIADGIHWGFFQGQWDWPDWYVALRIVSFLGGITSAAVICAVFRERRREQLS
jgi:hypothetical protein